MKFGLSYLLYIHSDLSFKLLFLKQTLIGNIGKFKKLLNNPFFFWGITFNKVGGHLKKKSACLALGVETYPSFLIHPIF